MQQPCLRALLARILELAVYIQAQKDMVGRTFFAGVALLTLVSPFELTAPLLRLPRQSVSNLEAAVVCAFVVAAIAVVRAGRVPVWRTPLTVPWIVVLLAMVVASLVSPVSRVNALHM